MNSQIPLPCDDEWRAGVRRRLNSRIGRLDPGQRTVILRIDSPRLIPTATGEYVGLGETPPVTIDIIDDALAGGLLISDGDTFVPLPPFDLLHHYSSSQSDAPFCHLGLRKFMGASLSVAFTLSDVGWTMVNDSREIRPECYFELDYTSYLEIVSGTRTVRAALGDGSVVVGDLDSLLDFGGLLFEPSASSRSVLGTTARALRAFNAAQSFNVAPLSVDDIRACVAQGGGSDVRVVEVAGLDEVMVVEIWARSGVGPRLLLQELVSSAHNGLLNVATDHIVLDSTPW